MNQLAQLMNQGMNRDVLVFFANAGFSISSIAICISMLFSYFVKNREKLETKSIIFILDLCAIIVMGIVESIYTVYYSKVGVDGPLSLTLYYIYDIAILFITTFSWMFVVTYRLSLQDEEKSKKKKPIYYSLIVTVNIILGILVFALPCRIYTNLGLYTFDSLAINIIVAYTAISTTMFVFFLYFRNPNITKRDLYPSATSLVLVVLLIFHRIVTGIDLNIETFQFTVFILGIFFTIENQDFKLIEIAQQKQEAAQKATASQKEFIASMSHQLRSPMNTILGLSQLILQEEDLQKESVKEDIGTINDTANSLMNLIDNITDYSYIVSGKEELKTEEYDMQMLVIKLDNDIMNNNTLENISFDFNISDSVPEKLYGDSDKISKILYNIISTMIINPHAGKVSLFIDMLKNKDSIAELEFIIKSTGLTLSNDAFDFESNDVVESDKSEMLDTTSLGLIIAKGLVDNFNGKLELHSEPGKGTSVSIVFNQSTSANVLVNKEVHTEEKTGEKEEVKEEQEVEEKIEFKETKTSDEFSLEEKKEEPVVEKTSEERLEEKKEETTEEKPEVKEEAKEEEKASEEKPEEKKEETVEEKSEVKEEPKEEEKATEEKVEEKKEETVEEKTEEKEEVKEEEKASEEKTEEKKEETAEEKPEVKEEVKEEEKAVDEKVEEKKEETPEEKPEVKEEVKEEEKKEETPIKENEDKVDEGGVSND